MSTMNDAALYSLRTRRRSASVRLRRRKATTAIVWRRHRFLISQIRTCMASVGGERCGVLRRDGHVTASVLDQPDLARVRTLFAMSGANSLYSDPVSSSRKASFPARKKTLVMPSW